MFKSFGLLLTLVCAMCLVGCGGDEGGNMIENEDQSAIEAYEASLLEEEAAMDADFEETP
jgi:hypothetical protein